MCPCCSAECVAPTSTRCPQQRPLRTARQSNSTSTQHLAASLEAPAGPAPPCWRLSLHGSYECHQHNGCKVCSTAAAPNDPKHTQATLPTLPPREKVQFMPCIPTESAVAQRIDLYTQQRQKQCAVAEMGSCCWHLLAKRK